MATAKQSHYISNPFKVIFNGFDRLFKYNQSMAIILLVISFIGSVGQFTNFGYGGEATEPAPISSVPAESSGNVVAIVLLVICLLVVVIVVAAFIGTMINGLMSYVAYKTSKGETTTLSESLKAVWNKFWTILHIEISVFFRILGGTLLFIIPGIRASLRYDMVLMPVFDENANAKEAIAKSKKITKDHLMEVFGMGFAAGIIPFIGQLMHVGGQSIMYPQLVALNKSGAAKPKVHWLNYLAFFLVGAILFLLVPAIVLLVSLLAN